MSVVRENGLCMSEEIIVYIEGEVLEAKVGEDYQFGQR